MSQIPAISNYRTEDFPGEEKWIGNLFYPLNQFFGSAIPIINGNVLFGDNIPTQTQAISITSSTSLPITFKYALSLAPVELRVCSATKNGTPIILLVAWQYQSGQITLTNIAEITGSFDKTAKYSIVLRINP